MLSVFLFGAQDTRTYKGKESDAEEVHGKSIVNGRIRSPQANPYCTINKIYVNFKFNCGIVDSRKH